MRFYSGFLARKAPVYPQRHCDASSADNCAHRTCFSLVCFPCFTANLVHFYGIFNAQLARHKITSMRRHISVN